MSPSYNFSLAQQVVKQATKMLMLTCTGSHAPMCPSADQISPKRSSTSSWPRIASQDSFQSYSHPVGFHISSLFLWILTHLRRATQSLLLDLQKGIDVSLEKITPLIGKVPHLVHFSDDVTFGLSVPAYTTYPSTHVPPPRTICIAEM